MDNALQHTDLPLSFQLKKSVSYSELVYVVAMNKLKQLF